MEVIQPRFLFLVRAISKAVDCGIVPDGNTICPRQLPISVGTYKNIICLKTAFLFYEFTNVHNCHTNTYQYFAMLCAPCMSIKLLFASLSNTVHMYMQSSYTFIVKLYSDMFLRWPPPP